MHKSQWSQALCVLICFLLLTPGSVQAAPVFDKTIPIKTSVKEQAPSLAKNKISADLDDVFQSKKNATFLVKFKTQADTKKAAANAKKLASKQKMTPAKKKFAQKSAVLSALRTTASETQANVIKYLDDAKKKGLVKNYQSFYIVNGIAVTGTKDVMKKMATFAEVDKILPNRTRQLTANTAIASGSETGEAKAKTKSKAKAKTATDDEVAWGVARIGAPSVWNMGIDGTGVVIASIDTGVQWDHPALQGKYRGYDPASPDQPDNEYNWFDAVAGELTPYDDIGHGTHTMGTMVGAENDGTHKIGVAPGARWISVKAFTPDGGTDVDLLEAGEWILAPKDAAGNPHPEMSPDIVNNSWGGGPGLDEWYRPMVQNWRAADIFPEFSAGNTDLFNPGGPGSVAAPANYPEAFAAGATDNSDQLAGFSLQGPSPYDETKPDVSAPGVNVYSSVPGSTYDGTYSGTSMAAPHVAGTAALLLSADASLTVDELEQIIVDTATPATDSTFPESPNNGYGSGIIDAFSAVTSITTGLGTLTGQVMKEGEDTEAPAYQHTPVSETYEGVALPLQISVQDNVSIQSVQLQYKVADGAWQTVEGERTEGDYRQGVYQATIPGDDLAQGPLTYKWHLTDFGGNEVDSDLYEVSVLPPITTGYSQDFESVPSGWRSYGDQNSWEWGVPASGPEQAASGEKVYATNLEGNYDNDANATLLMPPVHVAEGQSYLQFKNWYEIENNYDHGQVFVSTDQENWTSVADFTGAGSGWSDVSVDLSAYAGQNIFIGFNLSTDSSVVRPGWYIDDVSLTDTAATGATKATLGLAKAGKQADAPSLSSKKPVDPQTIQPQKVKNVRLPSIESRSLKSAPPAETNALPLDATVTVLETGRAVSTNPADGSYAMRHAAGTYTVKAERYGFASQAQTVEITRDRTTESSFMLQPIPQGTITGTITNDATGAPVSGATVQVMEDANIAPVQTDSNGHFELTVYEGTYTLHVGAPSYYASDVQVTVAGNESTEKNVALEPFIGYPGEIGYDDGTAENAHAFYDAGNGWAVKMSLAEGHDTAMVTGGLFRFWTDEWPVPGGTDFKVAVYDATGPDGAPGNLLAGPVDATALRDGSWTRVDLSDKGILVHGDFYMVYIQTDVNTQAPGLATDEDGTNAGRSWQLVSGSWAPSPAEEGNYMIRSTVSYEVSVPVITAPATNIYTNQERVSVEGKTAPATTVNLLNHGEKVAETTSAEDGTFASEVALQTGENAITVTASTDTGTTDPSAPVTVFLDQTKPGLTIDSPADGSKTNCEAVTVSGTVDEANLDSVKVNGQAADVTESGSYSKRILLDSGVNTIEVVAKDKAGNEESRSIRVDAKFTAPEITNLKPDEDRYLDAGQTVEVAFDSEPGLESTFVIQAPLTNTRARTTNEANELPLTETSAGHYVGYWTATSNLTADGAQIEVKARDAYGNETRQTAAGKLFINIPNEKPVAQFEAPAKAKKNKTVTFDASASSDPDGNLVTYAWTFGDGSTAEGETATHQFTKKGKYNVTLTVTDNRGKNDSITHTIKITR
ncbi:S8 family serine peptidase [Sporolactobacillus sp. Y61]|uniref:S8 family serine peptidase n=1 Tax=Sporolactobacillus sp. Y61 TaxID=3160863 RepID=A0AAU8II41_9BACL